MNYNPTRWVCQFPAERCNGIFYVYSESRPCPLAHKCLHTHRRTPLEYRYPQKHPNQRVLSLSDPQRYLEHAKRSCDLRRTFLQGEDHPSRRYYNKHREYMLQLSRNQYLAKKKKVVGGELLPCGNDCANCPYDDGCHYEDMPATKRSGAKPILQEYTLRKMVEEQYTVPQISEATGVGRGTIYARCRRLGIKPKSARKPGLKPLMSEHVLRKMVADQFTIPQISEATGIKPGTLYKRCQLLGLKPKRARAGKNENEEM